MKFVCSKQDLVDAVTTVQKAVMAKATLPILEGIYIEAGENVKLVGNCFDLGIEYILQADSIEKGSIVVNSRIFGDIVRRLPDSEVFIHVKDNFVVTIECVNSYFEIKGLSAEGYPMLPEVNEENKVSISQNTLRDMIRKTIYAISDDENRRILTGSLMEAADGDFSVVSLDGFRLAAAKTIIKENLSFKAVIPGKNLNEIQKILEATDKEVKITLSKNQALFEIDNCRIISSLLDGEYMNYRSFIPEQYETVIEVSVNEITQGIERASLITSDDKRFPVKLNIADNKLLITTNAEVGISKEEIDVEIDGNDLTIGFNPRYLLDSLKVIDDENIVISFSSSIGPSVIKPVSGDNYLFMVLPVRMSN
ncbi:MAG: DNA polymerase III subunit beta [Bacillota bacterium]|jgi:DNA polymerase-3 subunit beta|nr:DNA polymerase III subunit beta [Bacillota bacterium]